jgi:hypothetical protein
MSNIIFEGLLDKINVSINNINSYFNNADSYDRNISNIFDKLPKYNIIIYIFIIFLIFNFVNRLTIRNNEILVFLISTLLIYFLVNKDYSDFINYTNNKKLQLDFLNKLIFNNETYKVASKNYSLNINRENISYLHLNPLIVQFFYNIRDYKDYNISAYINSILSANTVIGLEFQSNIGINRTYLNYELSIEETKKSMNELNSMIYNTPSTLLSFNKLNDSLTMLHKLLNQLLINMATKFKNDNKLNDINLHSMPDNFYDSYFIISDNDTKTKGYMSAFNMY